MHGPHEASKWETRRLTATFSKTQVDRLGDRLRGGAYGESEVRLLDEYRRSFRDAYESVFRALCEQGFEPTGRAAKSIVSIVEKLRRESIRLSQMQDIGGCRIVVTTLLEQERSVSVLRAAFPQATVVDRRENPSHGYRAVHVIAEISGKPIEIQVRSSLQHLWAELSEKASDVLDPMIKYGGGPHEMLSALNGLSQNVMACEQLERKFAELGSRIDLIEKNPVKPAWLYWLVLPSEMLRKKELEELKESFAQSRTMWEGVQAAVADGLTQAISWLDSVRRESDDDLSH